MFIINALIAFGNWFWGIPILILLGCGGLYVTIRVGFLQFRHFGYICSQTFGKMFAKPETDDGVSPFAAACTALASSIGASNIVGVPVAIALGGPGAVFWIWVMAFIGMATKYTEVTLGLMYREKTKLAILLVVLTTTAEVSVRAVLQRKSVSSSELFMLSDL